MSPKWNNVTIKTHLEDIVEDVPFFDNVVQVFFPQFLGRGRYFLFTNSNCFFYLFMFSFYRNRILNHVRLDKKEDFVVPGINDIYARKTLICAGKKDVKYNTMFSKWVIIIGLMNQESRIAI